MPEAAEDEEDREGAESSFRFLANNAWFFLYATASFCARSAQTGKYEWMPSSALRCMTPVDYVLILHPLQTCSILPFSQGDLVKCTYAAIASLVEDGWPGTAVTSQTDSVVKVSLNGTSSDTDDVENMRCLWVWT